MPACFLAVQCAAGGALQLSPLLKKCKSGKKEQSKSKEKREEQQEEEQEQEEQEERGKNTTQQAKERKHEA